MQNPNLNLGGTLCFAKVGLSAGTNFSYSTTSTTNFIINGLFGVKFSLKTNQALPATDANTGLAFPVVPADNGMALVFGINAAGVVQLIQGDLKALEPGSLEFTIAPPFPSLPVDFCPIGYAIVKNDSGVNFTAGVTDWVDVDTSFVDVAILPDRPVEA